MCTAAVYGYGLAKKRAALFLNISEERTSMTNGKLLRDSQGDILPHLVDACPDAIIGVNTKGMVTIFNPAAAALTGHTIEDVVGKMHITRFYKDINDARMVK
jgi:PAS domain-containing protein